MNRSTAVEKNHCTIDWGHWQNNTAGSYYIHQTPDGQLNNEANKIYYDGGWKDIAPDHNHNALQSYTYNDDTVRIDGIVDVIDEILSAIQPVIHIGAMEKIARKLEKVRTQQNHWHVFNNPNPMIRDFDKNYKPKEPKIELEEDLFEL